MNSVGRSQRGCQTQRKYRGHGGGSGSGGGNRTFTRKPRRKFEPAVCDNAMTFEECELAVLRQAVDESETMQGEKIAQSPEVAEIIAVLERFLVQKQLICYGGTAINNILPAEAQFYNRNVEVPDYDFFSPNALADAKELADMYYLAGYDDVEAKAGVHTGTYKVFVNYLPIADITLLHPVLFRNLKEEAVVVEGIHYAPPNYLRMAMYLELSRPQGDVSRWEKVLKRINILNDHYPLTTDIDCQLIDFQRSMDDPKHQDDEATIYLTARDALISYGAVFLGGYGAALYGRYLPHDDDDDGDDNAGPRRQVRQVPDFDVLAEHPQECADRVQDALDKAGFGKHVKLVQHTSIGEVIPSHIEIQVGKDTVAVVYKPIACHAYNEITVDKKTVRVATIDTMLSFYLAFLYGDKDHFNKDRITCMAMYLFRVEQAARLEQKGLLRRFSLECYGKQPTMESIRAEKAAKFEELKAQRAPPKEREKWFLKYNPAEHASAAIQRKRARRDHSSASASPRSRSTSASFSLSRSPDQTMVIHQRGRRLQTVAADDRDIPTPDSSFDSASPQQRTRRRRRKPKRNSRGFLGMKWKLL